MLFVGRLVPKKGVDRLIAARGSDYHIALVGSGTVPSLPPGVTCLGPIERDELRDLYRAADLFAFPAVGEMLTLVMQEAMAAGFRSSPRTNPTTWPTGSGRTTSRSFRRTRPASSGLCRACCTIVHGWPHAGCGPAVVTERFEWRANVAQLMSLYQGTIASATGTDQSDADESEDAQVSRTTRRPH